MRRTPVRCGVIGHPLAHTRSPELHRAFAEQAGVALDYVVLDVEAADFERTVRDFFAGGGRGLNITLPYKAAALELAGETGAMARRAGAANVLTQLDDGRLRADNVDGIGFLRDLERRGFSPAGTRVCMLGAGGAAAGVACALLDAGVDSISVLNRNPQRARALLERLADERVALLQPTEAAFDLLVNATSASLANECPDFPDSVVGRGTLAYDLAYAEESTPFMRRAGQLGARVSDGWGMLVEQAAESFHLWHGVCPETGAFVIA